MVVEHIFFCHARCVDNKFQVCYFHSSHWDEELLSGGNSEEAMCCCCPMRFYKRKNILLCGHVIMVKK